MARWSKTRVGAGVAVGAVLAGCLVAARVIFSGADRDAAHVAGVSTSSSAGSSSAAPNNDRGARQATSSAEVMSVDGIDVDRVAKRTGAFQSMLDSLRYYAGRDRDPVVNTNRLDLASFVEGKTERELFQIGREIIASLPFGAVQIFGHLVATSDDPEIRVMAAGRFINRMDYWGDADRALADEAFRRVKAVYSDASLREQLSEEAVESGYWFFQKCRLFLDMSSYQDSMLMSDVVRSNAQTGLDRAYADFFEICALAQLEPEPDNIRRVQAVVARIEERGVYTKQMSADWVARLRSDSAVRTMMDSQKRIRELRASFVDGQ